MNPSLKDDASIKKDFRVLFEYLSMGNRYSRYNSDLSYVDSHPNDPGHSSKWNIHTRYHWVNLIPIIFGNKETIEFRIHTPTYDFTKIFNFIVLCSFIINYAKDNVDSILSAPFSPISIGNSSLFYILRTQRDSSYISKKIVSELCDYVRNRETFISSCMNNDNPWAEEQLFTNVNSGFWTLKRKQEKVTSENTVHKISLADAIQELAGETFAHPYTEQEIAEFEQQLAQAQQAIPINTPS
jgi:hypothetical protein